MSFQEDGFDEKNNFICIKLLNDNSVLKIDFSLSVKGYPEILSKINYNTKTLIIEEKGIYYKNLKNYFTYVNAVYNKKKNESLSNLSFNYKKLALLANYFQCENILDEIIKNNLVPNINIDTCISLINDAFKYCSENLNKNIKSKWFTLFLKLRDFLIDNFLFYLEDNIIERFKKINKKLLSQLVETFLFDIYAKGIEITSNHATKLIILIIYIREDNNYFDSEINFEKIFLLLKNSYSFYTSNQENYKFSTKPTYSINIMKDINFNYQEKLIQFYKQECIFISVYNKNDDSFSISLKLNPINNIEVFSFISYGHLIDNNENNDNNIQITYHTINSNKIVTLFTINNFRNYINYLRSINEVVNLILEINLKFCVIESFVICYLKNCFNQIVNEESIKNVPYNIFSILIYNINANQQYKEEDILKVIQNWLSDDLNYKFKLSKIQELFEQIEWKKIALGKIFEFVIKYPLVLEKLKQIENDIISSVFMKANDKLKEMKKDKLFTKKVILEEDRGNYSKRKNTIYSYEGEIERCEAIINESEKESKETKTKENSKDNNSNNIIENDINNNLINNESHINLLSYFIVNLVECSKKLNYHKLVSYFNKKEKSKNDDDDDLIEPFKFNNFGNNIKDDKENYEKKITEKDDKCYQTPLTIQDDIKIDDNNSEINVIQTDERIPTLDIGDIEYKTQETIKSNKTIEKQNLENKIIKEIEEIKEEESKDYSQNLNKMRNNISDNKSNKNDLSDIKTNKNDFSNYQSENNDLINNNDISDYKNNSFRSNYKKSNNNLSYHSINYNNSMNDGKKTFRPAVKLCSIVLKDKNNKNNIIYDANKK